jgi:hypothetical protein
VSRASFLASPATLLATGVLLAVCAFQLWVTPSNPPGFIRDEASIAYNAYTISQTGRDQDGGLLPLYITSFYDYKSPLFVYALAGVFRVTGPSQEAARATAAVVVLAAILLLGLLAYRRSRSLAVALAVVALGGFTPWLFQVGRVAYETCMEAAVLAVVLVLLDWGYRSPRAVLLRGIPVGLALGALAYTYAAGRLLAPLLAVALLVFAGRGRWRWLATIWGTFVLALVPLAVYAFSHPGALTARYSATTFITPHMSTWSVTTRVLRNYATDVDLWHWVSSGDPKPYANAFGAGELFGTVVVLALAGVVQIARRRPRDRWWLYVAAALVLSPIPAALTDDRYYSLRLLPLPVLLLVLAVPGLQWLRSAVIHPRSRWAGLGVAAVLAAAAAGQLVWFVHWYRLRGPARTQVFEAGVPALLERAFAGGSPVYIDHDDRYAQTHALWYAVAHGLPATQVSVLPDGGVAPEGASVFGRLQACDYPCTHLAEADTYWIARAQPSGS